MAWGNPMAVRWGRLYAGTEAEKSLEDAVAALGVPYRTQFPGWKYGCRFFPDFFLPTLGLVIEVDDKSHNEPEKAEADEVRSEVMFDTWGARTVRIPNEKALNDPEGSLRAALADAGLWPLPANLPRLRDALPPLRKAPKKERRQAKSAARRARRSKGRGSPSRPRTPATPKSATRARRPRQSPARPQEPAQNHSPFNLQD